VYRTLNPSFPDFISSAKSANSGAPKIYICKGIFLTSNSFILRFLKKCISTKISPAEINKNII
jgi:hypothetical protein